jgi:ethanolamine ammonia-lyase small subunit
MSASNAFEQALLDLLFLNTAIANVGDASGLGGSAAAGSAQVSLHTSALADTDTSLTTNEADYTGYARATVARSGSGWTRSGSTMSNAALIQFGQKTAGADDTVVHAGIGLISTGDVLRIHADLTADLTVSDGVNPQFAIGALDISLD